MSALARRRFAPLADEARAALDRREAQYPPLVQKGKIAADKADAEIRVWRAIAADWQAIVAGDADGLPHILGDYAPEREKIAMLEESIRRYDRQLAKAIDHAGEAMRRDFLASASLADLRLRQGDAADPVIAIHIQRERVVDLRDWYRAELPSSGRSTIGALIASTIKARGDDERRAAA